MWLWHLLLQGLSRNKEGTSTKTHSKCKEFPVMDDMHTCVWTTQNLEVQQFQSNAMSLINEVRTVDCSLGWLGPYMTCTNCAIIQRHPFRCPESPQNWNLGSSINYLGPLPLWELAKGPLNWLYILGQTVHSTYPTAHREWINPLN